RSRAWDRAAGDQQTGCGARRASWRAASYAHFPQPEPDRGRTRFLRVRSTADQRSRGSRIPHRLRPGLAVWRGARHHRARLLSPLCRAETPSFRARYPKVVVEMLVSERTSNLVEEGIDLAIRNGALSDSSLVARKIGESAVVAVASAEYLERRGEPTRLGDLDHHDGVILVSQD